MSDTTKVFYAVELTRGAVARRRYQLYELTKPRPPIHGIGEGLNAHAALQVVWPETRYDGNGKLRVVGKLLPFQSKTDTKRWPRFHFAVSDQGYSELQALANALAAHFKCRVDVRELHGNQPSSYFASYFGTSRKL